MRTFVRYTRRQAEVVTAALPGGQIVAPPRQSPALLNMHRNKMPSFAARSVRVWLKPGVDVDAEPPFASNAALPIVSCDARADTEHRVRNCTTTTILRLSPWDAALARTARTSNAWRAIASHDDGGGGLDGENGRDGSLPHMSQILTIFSPGIANATLSPLGLIALPSTASAAG
ncbi:hypothetical protein OF83DRAFT_1089347, partial [Amylostereum chailletii]